MGCFQSYFSRRVDLIIRDNVCAVCLSASSNVIIYPCGHFQLCSVCAAHIRKWRMRKCVRLNQNTNKFFYRISCPTCFENGGLIKIFPAGNHKCRVCKEQFVDALILPCSHFEICYKCCLDFSVNRLQITVMEDHALSCPICRDEGAMFTIPPPPPPPPI